MTVGRWIMVVTRISAEAFVWGEQTRFATMMSRHSRRTLAMLTMAWSSMAGSSFLSFRKKSQ
jgi:hypothetical protein